MRGWARTVQGKVEPPVWREQVSSLTAKVGSMVLTCWCSYAVPSKETYGQGEACGRLPTRFLGTYTEGFI